MVTLDDPHAHCIKKNDTVHTRTNTRLAQDALVLIQVGHLGNRVHPHGIYRTDLHTGGSFAGATDIRDVQA